jgi:hypothetical protein
VVAVQGEQLGGIGPLGVRLVTPRDDLVFFLLLAEIEAVALQPKACGIGNAR